MRKILGFILVFVIMMTIFTGCGILDRFGSESGNNDELNPTSSVTMGDNDANGVNNKTPIKLYFINEKESKLSAETRYIDSSESSKGNEYLATLILKELIKGPAKGSSLKATIPQGTTVHANVTIKDNIATVDLSKEFISKHSGGKKNEQLTLYSIVNTLTELKDIKSVKFKIDGNVVKEFKGNYQINVEYPRSAYLISVQKAEDSTGKVDSTKDSTKDDIKGDTKDNTKENSKEQGKGDSSSSSDKKTNADGKNNTDEVETNGDPLE